MLEWTDRHCRNFLRLISRHALLYTEMVTTAAVIHGDRERLLGYHPEEHPLALQLGGSEPEDLAVCARIGADLGYDEINLNVGCPSDRVQKGRFGACLMAEPDLVARCIQAMGAEVAVPVTVKTRIGIDDRDSYEELADFVGQVAEAGCRTFIIHARKAWLSGLSPKENRDIPSLRYDVARRLKADFPQLEIVLNGGILTLDDGLLHLADFDGVMVGRAAYHAPYLLAEVDRRIYGDDHPVPSRHQVLERFLPYVESELAKGTRLQSLSRHILGLFHQVPGGRRWRRYLSENAFREGASVEVLQRAAEFVGSS
jgi:tRNA-dihydrouridine synthase A